MNLAKTILECLDKHAGALSALFLGALVITSFIQNIFILRANQAALQAANTAKESADGLQIAERAYVAEGVAEQSDVLRALFNLTSSYPSSPPIDEQSNAQVCVKIWFTNYGKTPATMRYWAAKLSIESSIPREELEPKSFEIRVLAPQEHTSDNVPMTLDIFSHSLEQSEKLNEGRLELWLFGYVEFEAIFGNVTRRNFVWRYNRHLHRFVPFSFYIEDAK